MLEGKKLGPFLIDKEIGAGAMGTVYRAKHETSGQRVAIKIMSPGLGSSDRAMARFQREADILKQLKHPHIVRIYAHGKYQRMPFYVMEYIEGESLDHALARRGRLTWEEVVTLGQQLCAALQHAHEHGIVHRDLKPSNLMVLPSGTVKLTDFGIAKDLDVTQLTSANCTVGTAAYMSPEQCRGERNITNKSDLYSLGVMFYELLTGKKPFLAENAMDMFLQHTAGTFERPSRLVFDVPIWLDTLICQLLEKKPEQRPLDAHVVGQALERIKEKVEAQQSAGVEVAKQRRIDRNPGQPSLDEEDKEAARTLLRKKKKKKAAPFYSHGWFQVTVVSVVLLVLGYVFYGVFLRPASAEDLWEEARGLKDDRDIVRRQQARKVIQEFLDRFPSNHLHFAEMQRWADRLDRDISEEQMHKRRAAGFQPQGEAEIAARRALDDEESGNLIEADKTWKGLVPLKAKKDPDERGWGLVAEKYLEHLKDADAKYEDLLRRVNEEKETKKELQPESDSERLAVKAVRSEAKKELAAARLEWEDLKKKVDQKGEQRPWFLLAARRARELAANK